MIDQTSDIGLFTTIDAVIFLEFKVGASIVVCLDKNIGKMAWDLIDGGGMIANINKKVYHLRTN